MNEIVFSLIVIACMVICFVTEIVPISVTALAGCLAFAISGIITFPTAFAGFSNDTVLMIAGAMIVGDAMFETGAAQFMGEKIIKLVGYNERRLMVVLTAIVGLLSAFMSNSATMAMFIPLIRSVAASSNGKIKARHLIMPMGLASLAGGCCTIVGSTPQLIAQSLLEEGGYRTFSFFELGFIGFPILAFLVIYFGTYGYKTVMKATAYMPEPDYLDAMKVQTAEETKLTPKIIISTAIMVLMIVCFLADIWTMGAVALVSAMLCIVTKCIPAKKAYSRISWSSLIVIAATIGVGKGLTESGTALAVAEAIADLLGENPSPLLLLVVVGLLCTVLANFLSHTAALALLVPVFIPLSNQLGIDATLFIFAVTCFINIGYSTPLGAASYSMTLQEGYKFKDYAKVGGLFNIVCYAIVLVLCYLRFVMV